MGLPYTPTIHYTRTDSERRDPFLSWVRDDRAFFASGACHILASLFVQMHQHEGFRMEFLRPLHGMRGSHVYATDGTWAFDFDGWTPTKLLLASTSTAYRDAYPGWEYELTVINEPLDKFCAQNNHRPPQNFFHLPWERTYKYIESFSKSAPQVASPGHITLQMTVANHGPSAFGRTV